MGKKKKEKLAVLNNLLWVPTDCVDEENEEDYTYRNELVVYEPNLQLSSECSNCDLWGRKWRPGNRTCEDMGYTLNEVCSSFTHKRFPVRQEQIIKTWKKYNEDWCVFARGDLDKVKRNFGHLGIEDQRARPKLPFDLICKTKPYDYQQVVVDEWLTKGYGILQAPTSWGKSCHFGTVVPTNQGLLTMGEIVKRVTGYEVSEIPEGVSLPVPPELDLHTVATGGFSEPISHLTAHKAKTVKVTTDWGNTVEATPEHPFMVCNPEKGPEWRQAKDIKPGDKVGIRTFPLHRGEDVPVLSDETYRLMGILTADGTCSVKGQLTVTGLRVPIIEEAEHCFRSLGADPKDVWDNRKDRKEGTAVHSVELYGKMVLWGLSSTTAAFKKVPWTVMRGGEDAAKQYLRGYFTGDGFVEESTLILSAISASRGLLDGIQLLLLGLGIPSTIQNKKTTYKGEVREGYWRLTIDRTFVSKFNEVVGFLPGCHKDSQIKEVLVKLDSLSVTRTYKYTIPANVLMRNLYLRAQEAEDNGTSGYSLRKQGLEHYVGPSNKKQPPNGKVKEFLETYKTYEEYAEYEALNVLHEMSEENGTFWVPVASVEEGKDCIVVDITVPDKHYYVGNGFVSHNTVAWAWLIAKLGLNTLLLAQETRHINVGYEGLYEHTNVADLEMELGEKLVGRINKKYKKIGEDPKTGHIIWRETACKDAHYPITFSTFQALASKSGKKLRKKLKNYFGVVWSEECLTGDTLIPTNRGVLRLDEIAKGGSQDISEEVATRWGLSKASRWINQGKRETLKVTTSLGNSIKCTPEHKLLVLNSNSYELEWTKAEDLSEGDFLCVPSIKVVRNSKLELPQETGQSVMTPDLAFILGMIVAEGGVYNRRLVQVTNTCPLLLDAYEERVQRVLGKKSSRSIQYPAGSPIKVKGKEYTSNSDCFVSHFSGKEESELLIAMGVTTNKGPDKVVPWSIMQADEESQRAFLAAYLECDGFIAKESGHIGFCSSSNEILRQIQSILFSYGYSGTKIKWPRKSCGYVRVSNEDSALLVRKLHPWLVEKFLPGRERRGSNLRGIPAKGVTTLFKERLVPQELKRSRRKFRTDEDKVVAVPHVEKQFIYDYAPEQKVLAYSDTGDRVIDQVGRISKEMHSKLQVLRELEYMYVPVTEVVSNGVENVYDLTIEDSDNRSFVANGVVSSNCHHSSAQTFNAVYKSFNPKYRGGQTATPTRKDMTHVAIYDMIGPITAKGTKEAMTPMVSFHNTNVFVPDSCFNAMYPTVKIMNHLALSSKYRAYIRDKVLEEIEEGRKVLLITDRVNFGVDLMQKVKIHGYGVEMVRGGTKKAHRMKEQNWYAEALMSGDISLIIGTKVINENVNIPPMDSLHLPFPSFTKETEEQRAGRVRRYLSGSNKKFLEAKGIDWDKPQPRIHVYTWTCNTDSKGRNFAATASGFRAKLYKSWDFDFDGSENNIESSHKKKTMRSLLGDDDDEE